MNTDCKCEGRHYGKYRGVVVNNVDPQQIGRVQVSVAELADSAAAWAMPCAPVAGPEMGLWAIPPIGAHVWVEFEGGDPDHPIWSGGWWDSSASIPTQAHLGAPNNPPLVIQTTFGHSFTMSDVPGQPGGLTLRSATGAFITVNDLGILISNGKGATIALTGPQITFDAVVAIDGFAVVNGPMQLQGLVNGLPYPPPH